VRGRESGVPQSRSLRTGSSGVRAPGLVQFVLLLLFAGYSTAQTQTPVSRGVWLAGGSVSVRGLHDEANNKNEFALEVTPQVGYFVFDRLAISANLRFGIATRESSGRTISWGVGPGVTYYFKGFGPRFYPYGTGRFMVSRSHFYPADDAPTLSPMIETEHTWQVGVGGAFFVAHNVALTAELFLSRAKFEDAIHLPDGSVIQKNTSTLYGLQLGLRVFIY